MEPMIRGYSVKQQLNFLERQYEPAVSRRLLETIPTDVRTGLGDLKAAEWYPRAYSIGVLRAIASNHGSDEKGVYSDLARCGTFIATEATNTFLKLLMKILTPALFAKKIPEFWKRDQTGGHFEVDTSGVKDGTLKLELCDVEGFDHIGVIGIGWISYGLTAMGKSNVVVTQKGWALANPGPKNIEYHVRWT